MKKKVFVAMSGGVDSSVSAALLQKEGYDITGVFMTVWQPDFLECSRSDDRQEAMRAAAHLDIPFLTFDFEKEYKEMVVDYMVAEYKVGRTPNPDIMCNKHIKFGLFLKKALAMGADHIATGHYARRKELNSKNRALGYELLAGVDKNKDQSYFLWTLGQEQLSRVFFPVGDMEKPEVRKLAQKLGLPNAERKDSQGVCFVGEFDMKNFLKHYISEKRGEVLSEKGEAIGYHDGAFYFTLGERHGFVITKKTPHDDPYYVVGKDSTKNTLTVAHQKIQETSSAREIVLRDVNFIAGFPPDESKKYTARARYRQPLASCAIQVKDDVVSVVFDDPRELGAPGQSLVLYDGEVCLGGGIIA
ncbi:MAG TPA: tRNA 2-thiouridine(34) synthase MnmA [Candidatus Paceibacterota bacterium]